MQNYDDYQPNRGLFRTVVLWMLFIAALIAIAFALGLPARFLGREVKKFDEETRAQVYDTSRQYNQGINRDVARYCEQMRREPSESGKRATAALIRSTTSTFDGKLNQDNMDCVAEARTL